MTKIAGSGSESGSKSQRHGSADPDPDPHQNVMDPQHCFLHQILTFPDFGVLRDFGLDVGALKDGLVVVDVPQLDDDPGVGHVVLVVVVVLPLVVHLDPEPGGAEKRLWFRIRNFYAERILVLIDQGSDSRWTNLM